MKSIQNKRGRPKTMKDSTTITIRLPAEMVAKLRERGNYSELIRSLIDEHLRPINKSKAVIKVLALVLCVSCGEKRCYSKQEAMLACVAQEMSERQVDQQTAEMICKPSFQYEGCYSL